MAHSEACQLFIEQQIEEGLQEGKKPYAIGKELTVWLERLFEAHIPAKTIAKRADRMKEKLSTNVECAPTPESAKEKEHIQEIKSDSWIKEDVKGHHGGKRKGAGRPKEYKYTETFPVTYAEHFVDMAILQLERIPVNDPQREAALKRLLMYVQTLLEGVRK